MIGYSMNTLPVKGQTVELQCWLDNIFSCRAILRNADCWYSTQGKPFSQMALWSMNQLQDVKPMVHSWKSSCCPTYKVVMVN